MLSERYRSNYINYKLFLIEIRFCIFCFLIRSWFFSNLYTIYLLFTFVEFSYLWMLQVHNGSMLGVETYPS